MPLLPTRERLAWLRRRLDSMPAAELPHRLREALRRRADRAGGPDLPELRRDLLLRPVPALRVDPAALAALAPADVSRVLADADAILGDRFSLLGLPAAGRVAWDVDPETGLRWPALPAAALDLHSATRDVKPAWELHRLQHVQVLALAARLGHPRAADGAWSILSDWLEHDRAFHGIAWAGGIECGLRVVSLLAIAGLLGADAVPVDLRPRWWRALLAHGTWIARYPSRFSSANNHRVAELAALVLLGRLAPDLPGAAGWRAASSELRAAGLDQLHPDGVGVEQSPTYQSFTMELLLLAGRVVPLGAALEARLLAGAAFLERLCDEDGRAWRVGDDDEGRALRPLLAEPAYVASVAAAVRAGLGPAVDGTAAGALPPDPRAALLGQRARPAPAPPTAGHRTWPDGGYTAWRRSLEGHAVDLLADHGPLGFRWTGSHGHADALSLWLRLDGRDLLVDRGTFRYNGLPAWRAWARHSASHNTATVDGASQSETTGPFNWGRRAAVTVERIDADGLVARHDGYAPVVHTRELALTEGELAVTDRFEGPGAPELALHWHLAPDLDAAVDGAVVRITRAGAPVATLRVDGADALTAHRDGHAPGPGTHSPSYNRRVPAWTVRAVARGPLPRALRTAIAPD